MIYLYDSTTKVFTYNGQPMPKAYEVITDRTINDEFFVTGKHPLDESQRYKLIQKDKIIKAHTPDGMQPFRIMDVNKRLGYVEFEAWPLLYADLRKKLIKPFTLRVATGQSVLNTFVGNLLLDTPFTFNSNIIDTHDFKVQDETEAEQDPNQLYDALDILKRIVNRWGGELIIDGYDIRMVDRIGKDTDALLYEKKNITDFVDKESIQEIVTRLHGKAEWTEDNPNEGDQITKRIQTTVNSPLINAYSGIVFEQQFTNNDIHTEQELKNWLNLKFNTENIDKPSRSIELDTNIIDATEIALGDTLNLKYLKHDVDMLIRVMRYQYDGFNNRYIKIYVGDSEEHFTGSVKNSITTLETNVKNSVDKTIAHVIINQLGQKIIYSEYEPEGDYSEGDIWFDNKGGMFFWDEESANWIPHPFNDRVDAIGQEVEAAIKQADADREAAEKNFEQAVVDAATYTNTKAQEFDNKLGVVNQELANITQSANAAISKADQAIQDVGFMQIDVNAAKTKATSALENANTAKANASTALTNANSALTKVGALEVTTGSLQTSYNELTKTVGLKADKTTVDGINSKVTQHGLDITANATAVGLKADKSVVDSIKGTVDKHTLDIKAAADGLTLKADSSLVNTIKGTVDTHTTQISANSTAINARLTSAQVETLLTGKKYVNETTLNATANSLSASITQISSDLNNLEIGGRNYLRNTGETTTNNIYVIGYSRVSSGLEMYRSGEILKLKIATNTSERYYRFINPVHNNIDGEVIVPGETYTIIGMYRTSDNSESSFYVRSQASTNGATWNLNYNTSNFDLSSEWKSFSYTFTLDNDAVSFYISLQSANNVIGSFFEVKNLAFVKGEKAVYTVAPEDMATLEQFTTIDATVKGLQTTVGNKAEQSQVTQLAGQISSKVESATYNSKMTQLDNAINLRVQAKDVTEAILADKTVKDTRSTNQLPSWYFANYPKQTVEEFKQRTTMGVPGSATYGQLTTKVLWNSTSGGSITQMFYSSDGVFQRVGNAAATAWLAWDKVAEAGQLLSQINLSTEGVLIQGKRIQLDGEVTMTSAFVTDIKAKSLEAVYADIATLKTKVLTADVITSTMVKSDTALVDKIFATDANVNRFTAKTAFINSVKAIDIAADRITTGTLNAANVNIINLNASKIVASSLSALTTNTGALNVTDWLTFSTDNKGIRANYDFGDQLGGSFDPRWFVGNYTLGYRYMKFLADVYTVSASGGRGNYGYYSETFYGPDYFKLRQYRNSTMSELLTRIDMRSEYISMSTSYSGSNIYLNANGDSFFSGNMQVGGDIWVLNSKALKAYYVQAPDTTYNLYLNGGRNDLGSMRLGVDGSTLNGGRLVSSDSVYKRTYSSAANVVVFDTGTIGRAVSARKYKLNIESNHLLETALKTLAISPSSWHDKAEVESIAKTMSNGTEQELDPNFRLKRHHGFVADEFHEKGATEVVVYNSNGEVEGLAYDRISMYHHELIKDLYNKIEQQENKIKELERKTA